MEFFSGVKDPRVLGKVKHELEDVLHIALIGVLRACEDYDEISDFIENRLHWHLDVTFKEDDCRVRTKNGAVNLSALRKFAMELLKKQKDKLSLKRRRKKFMLNLDYLAKVVNEV